MRINITRKRQIEGVTKICISFLPEYTLLFPHAVVSDDPGFLFPMLHAILLVSLLGRADQMDDIGDTFSVPVIGYYSDMIAKYNNIPALPVFNVVKICRQALCVPRKVTFRLSTRRKSILLSGVSIL